MIQITFGWKHDHSHMSDDITSVNGGTLLFRAAFWLVLLSLPRSQKNQRDI